MGTPDKKTTWGIPYGHEFDLISPSFTRDTQGRLIISGLRVDEIVSDPRVKSPCRIVDVNTLNFNLRRLTDNLPPYVDVAYATKANLSLTPYFASHNTWLEGMSKGELEYFESLQVPGSKIVCTATHMDGEMLDYAVDFNNGEGIYSIHVQSLDQARRLNDIAKAKNKVIRVGVRIEPTFVGDRQFGIQEDVAEQIIQQIAALPYISLEGIHFHISSYPYAKKFVEYFRQLLQVAQKLQGYIPNFHYLDIGGGFAVSYDPGNPNFPLSEVGPLIEKVFDHADFADLKQKTDKLIIEPGRSLVNNAEIYVAKVGEIKTTLRGNPWVILDGGISDLLRPALTKQIFPALNASRGFEKGLIPYRLAGPTGIPPDRPYLDERILLPADTQVNDFIAFFDTGAYGPDTQSTGGLLGARPIPALVAVFEVTPGQPAYFVLKPQEESADRMKGYDNTIFMGQ